MTKLASTDKVAGIIDGLGRFVRGQRKLVSDELKRTRPHHILAGKDSGYSIHRMLLDTLAESGAFGANATRKAIGKAQYNISKLDTALGALARGHAKPGSIRYSMFTNIKGSDIPVRVSKSGKLVPEFKKKTGVTRQLDRASISAPIKAISGPVATGLAITKAGELLQGVQNTSNREVLKQNEQY
jgi:hypothetical protein